MINLRNILTIDVEDWYQTESYKSKISVSSWNTRKSKLIEPLLEILDVLKKFNIKATFFILVYNVYRHPEIINLLKSGGHEIALHGYYHNLIYRQKPSEFRKEIEYSKKMLEDLSGVRIIGYRAPNWSLILSCFWALEILNDLGFLYDSSMTEGFLKKNEYKIPPQLIEIPRSSFTVLNISIPFGGGFFLRAYPYFLTNYLMRCRSAKNKMTLIYIHPWELVEKKSDRPRLSFLNEVKSGFRLSAARAYLNSLLKDFKFDSIRNIYFNEYHDK